MRRRKSFVVLRSDKHAVEDPVHVAQVALHRESRCNFFGCKEFPPPGVTFDGSAEVSTFLPASHCVPLNQFVSLLTKHPGGSQIEQELSGEDDPLR